MLEKNNSLAKNSLFNLAYNLMKVVFPLIYASYVAHVLLDSGVGKVSYAQNIAQYFLIIASLGIPNYGVREIARVRNNSEGVQQVFSELFWMNALSTIIFCLAYYLMIYNVAYFSDEKKLYAVVGISIILNIANIDWFYQGIEEFSYIAVRSFCIKIISMILIFVFIKAKEDYIVYALISVVGVAGNNIVNLFSLKKYGIKFRIKHIYMSRHLRSVIILLGTSLAIELYTLLDTTMIGILCDYQSVGYYTNSMKLVKVVIITMTSVNAALLPRLSLYYAKNDIVMCSEIISKAFSILLFLFIPCGIGMILTADLIIPVLFGQSFLPAVTTFRIVALLIYALGFSNLFGTQVLLTFSQERKLLICTVVGAVTNFTLNLIIIPIWQQNGAAVASVISESVVTIISIIFACRYVDICVCKTDVVKSIVATILMSGGIWLLKSTFVTGIMSLVVLVFLGIFIYLGACYAMKNSVLLEFLSLIRDKRKNKLVN